jgi:hypothetical protein
MPCLYARWQDRREPYVFLFTANYRPYRSLEPLLRALSMTGDVAYVDVGTNAFDPNDWRFPPSRFGYAGDYINLGLTTLFTQPMSEYYAEAVGYRPDYGFRFCLPEPSDKHRKYCDRVVTIDNPGRDPRWKAHLPADAVFLSLDDSHADNALYAKFAKRCMLLSSMFAHILEFADVPCTVFWDQTHHPSLMHRNPDIVRV